MSIRDIPANEESLDKLCFVLGDGDRKRGEKLREKLPCSRYLFRLIARDHESSMLLGGASTPYHAVADSKGLIENRPEFDPLGVGVRMEDAIELVAAAASGLEDARKELQKLANDSRVLADVILPKMTAHIMDIRSARMTIVKEVHESLACMREVRKFFLDRDYDVEMDRLRRFVAVCKELKAIKDDGTLDAVSLIALKLAIREDEDGRK